MPVPLPWSSSRGAPSSRTSASWGGLEAGGGREFGLVLNFRGSEEGFPFVGDEEDFLVVAGGDFFGFDVDEVEGWCKCRG